MLVVRGTVWKNEKKGAHKEKWVMSHSFFLIFRNFSSCWKIRKLPKNLRNRGNLEFLETAIFFLSIKTLFETVRAGFSSF